MGWLIAMENLQFYVEELPELAGVGARYVIVAYCGTWRDGEVTSDASDLPALQRKLRKRFMSRLQAPQHTQEIDSASNSIINNA